MKEEVERKGDEKRKRLRRMSRDFLTGNSDLIKTKETKGVTTGAAPLFWATKDPPR